MNAQSENQNIGDHPVRSPSVSDEILYELGYSISPSQEEKDEPDDLKRTAVDQSEINEDCNDQSEFTENFAKIRNTSELDVKQVEESENSTKEIACVLDKKETGDHIGSELITTSYPGHKLKDKKYLRKIKKRRRRKKGKSCSPTKIEAICREMSGLVVSEDDASATETSPESEQSEEITSHQNDSKEKSLQNLNHESKTSEQIHKKTVAEKNKDTSEAHSNIVDFESKTENSNLSGEATADSSSGGGNLLKVKDCEVVREISPKIPSNPTFNTQKCSKSSSGEELAKFAEMKETGSTDIPESVSRPLLNESMEIESTENETGGNSVEKQVILQSSSSSGGKNYIDSSENSLQPEKDQITSACTEFSYEELFGNIKKCSIKIRRLSEESIAVHTGGSRNKQTNKNLQSEVSHVSTKQIPNSQPPLSCESLVQAECSETYQKETSNTDNSEENGYTSSVMWPEKVQDENKILETTLEPSKLNSSDKRRSRRLLPNKICPPLEPEAKSETSPSKGDTLNTKEVTHKPSFSETRGCENLRSIKGRQNVKQGDNVTTDHRNRRKRPGLFESLSEVNFKHKMKSTNLMKNLEERNVKTKQSQSSAIAEKFSALTCKNFLEQMKRCSVNLKKIDSNALLTRIPEKAMSTVDFPKVDLETFKVPLIPDVHLRPQRMQRKTSKTDSGSSLKASPNKSSSTNIFHKPATKLSSPQETVSEIDFRHNLSREQSWQQKFMASLKKSMISGSNVEKELCYSETCSSVSMKACSVKLRKLSADSLASFSQGVVSSKKNNIQAVTKELRSNNARQLRHVHASESSPIKLCSVNIQRLSDDTITTRLKRNMHTILDKDLARRTEKSDLVNVRKESAPGSSSLGFLVPSLPVRKRRGSGDTVSTLSKWSTRRQPLKATKPSRGKAPKRKWIDSDSVDSESSVRPCSVKLLRLDPDSVSNCATVPRHHGGSMPDQIRNPDLNIKNVDKVVDDELYCLRKFLQVPMVPEPGSSVISAPANKSGGKHKVPKMKPCSVVLRRITKNHNLQSVNIKKVIAKQLADDVEFSSESESSHEDKESTMDINKLLFSLKDTTGGEEKHESQENEPAQDDMELMGKISEGTADNKKEGVNHHGANSPVADEITEELSLPDRENGKTDMATAKVMGPSADGSGGDPPGPVVIQTAAKIVTDDKTAEEILSPGDHENAPQTLTKTVPLPVRRPESDIWSDDLPDIDVDLSVASVCSAKNSSLKGDAGKKNGDTCADLHRDYFQLAKLTKSCSVRLQKIDVI